jgi:hypothetical protein
MSPSRGVAAVNHAIGSEAISADVISPQFPCGAAWLANALLELGVELPSLWGFDTAREWRQSGISEQTYIADEQPWRQTLASLRPGRTFALQPGQRVRFSHAFPWQIAGERRRILLLRDPRDALHSEWQRQRRNLGLPESVDLPGFSELPFFDGPISQIDMLWLHISCWLPQTQNADDQTLLLRFEDCKQTPHETLARVADWLGIETSEPAITKAVEASRVEHLQRVEAELAPTAGSRIFNRAGLPFEWLQRWPAHWHSAFGAHWQAVLLACDYPPLQAADGPPPNVDFDRVLTWRELHDIELRAQWSEWITARLAS